MFEQAFKNIDDVLWKDAGCTSELDYTEQTSWLLFLKYLDALEQDKTSEAALNGKKYTHILDKPYRWETWAAPKGPSTGSGQVSVLLTLATGTGKTFIAFQIAWKLFHSRWNLSREPSRRPRILFLADRNILANQAYNAFSAFPEDALVRIDPESIRKKGKVPKNGSIFFTIFQTFMSGPPKDGQPCC